MQGVYFLVFVSYNEDIETKFLVGVDFALLTGGNLSKIFYLGRLILSDSEFTQLVKLGLRFEEGKTTQNEECVLNELLQKVQHKSDIVKSEVEMLINFHNSK